MKSTHCFVRDTRFLIHAADRNQDAFNLEWRKLQDALEQARMQVRGMDELRERMERQQLAVLNRRVEVDPEPREA